MGTSSAVGPVPMVMSPPAARFPPAPTFCGPMNFPVSLKYRVANPVAAAAIDPDPDAVTLMLTVLPGGSFLMEPPSPSTRPAEVWASFPVFCRSVISRPRALRTASEVREWFLTAPV